MGMKAKKIIYVQNVENPFLKILYYEDTWLQFIQLAERIIVRSVENALEQNIIWMYMCRVFMKEKDISVIIAQSHLPKVNFLEHIVKKYIQKKCTLQKSLLF